MRRHSSRYDAARPFDPPPPEAPGMARPRDIVEVEGAVEHTVVAGDRLDLMALEYYGDARLWWRILDANPQLLSADDLRHPDMQGRVVTIPRSEP